MTVSLGMAMTEKSLTSVSTSKLFFTNQNVDSLVIVPESPDVGSVIQVRKTAQPLGGPHPIGSSLTQVVSPYPATSPSHSMMNPMT